MIPGKYNHYHDGLNLKVRNVYLIYVWDTEYLNNFKNLVWRLLKC